MEWQLDLKRDRFYRVRKRRLWSMYWKNNNGSDIFRPNGFKEYPEDIYNLFLTLIDHDGKVIDLGCGNGLMLRHLLTKSRYKLVPYGVDFIEESIKQARETILPMYAENFMVRNIIDLDLGRHSYDFIFFDPYNVHSKDMQNMINKLLKACRPGGKIIFYTYRDVLKILKLLGFFKLKWIEWVGDLLPTEIAKRLKRIEHSEVSVGVLSLNSHTT
jgi:2-polyprenyl-3-methyl-5-hydroxy-6-metoxy-1,4-benzoquinol methylase